MFIENFLQIMIVVAVTGIFLASFYDRKDGEK
jgi:hypothetical protein